jgi:tRNA uridine 5-carboxymethylaminomethyl modification enzyme
MARLKSSLVGPKRFPQASIEAAVSAGLDREVSALELLRRPDVHYQTLMEMIDHQGATSLAPELPLDRVVQEQVEIQIKYQGYISRQVDEVARHQAQEEAVIPLGMNYREVSGLSNEVRQRLEAVSPHTLGQASRISGVTPAAISLLWIHLKRLRSGPTLGGSVSPQPTDKAA